MSIANIERFKDVKIGTIFICGSAMYVKASLYDAVSWSTGSPDWIGFDDNSLVIVDESVVKLECEALQKNYEEAKDAT